jgi:glucose/arabinose dehydrogenase
MTLPRRLLATAAVITLALAAPAAERRRAAPKRDQSHFCDFGTDVAGVKVPAEFCIRKFVSIPTPRTLVFAPNGDLFVSSPRRITPGAAPAGAATIFVLRETNSALAPQQFTFAQGAAFDSVHGLLIRNGRLYYTLDNAVMSVPYHDGDTTIASDQAQQIADLTPANALVARWVHSLAMTTDGTLYVSRGQYDNSQCPPTEPRTGAVLRVGGTADVHGDIVADGMRDPLFLRCMPWNRCYTNELSGDAWAAFGGHEKLLEFSDGQHLGYPCCVDRDLPAPEQSPAPDCSKITSGVRTFPLHDTPFGFDWERDFGWPDAYKGAFFVALHGEFNTWIRAGLKWAPTDPVTHLPLSDPQNFATGFGRGGAILRPTDLLFAPDGRLFFGDDMGGAIYWIAPRTLKRPAQ